MSDQTPEISAAEWLAQAQEEEDSDNTASALDKVEKAIQKDPTLGAAWRLKASLLQDLDRPREAFNTLNEACHRLPHDAGCWFDLGAFLATHNNLPQAIDCYMRCYNLDSSFPRIKTNLGMAFINVRDFENAANMLTEALEENSLDADKARILNRLAEAHIALGKFDKAFECLDKALVLDENNFVAMANMAMVHLQRGEKEAARSAIENALSKDTKNANLYEMRAAIYDESDSSEDKKEAEKSIETALKLAPEDPEIWIKVANRHLHFQDRDNVFACLDKAVELDPGNYQIWHNRAFLLSQLPDTDDEVLRSLDHSIECNPIFPGNWLNKAQLLHKIGKNDEAAFCHRRGMHLLGHLVIWGIFLIDEQGTPVEGTQMAIETERSVPQSKIIEQYVENLKKDNYTIDDQGIVNGKYRIAMTQVPLEQVENKPVYKDDEAPKTDRTKPKIKKVKKTNLNKEG